jgi:hypothetical protein
MMIAMNRPGYRCCDMKSVYHKYVCANRLRDFLDIICSISLGRVSKSKLLNVVRTETESRIALLSQRQATRGPNMWKTRRA